MENIRHYRPIAVWRNPHTWYITTTMMVCAIFYYLGIIIELIGWPKPQWEILSTVHDLHRLLFFVPVLYAAYIFRVRGAIVTAVISMLIFLHRATFISPYPESLLRPMAFVIILGGVGILTSKLLDNITERRRAEQALRESRDYLERLTNSMWDAVFSIKMPERVIEWANDSFRLIGYNPEECVGRTTEFLYPDKSEFLDFGNKLKNALAAGKDILHAEQLLKRKGGEVFPAEITTTVYKEKGEVARVTSIVRDITKRKRLEQLKEEFIGLVSHELRSPLTVITGAVNTVLTEGARLSPEETRQLLNDAASEADSLSHLLGNLLELSRVQANRLFLHTEAISVRKVIQDTVEEIKRQSSAHQFVVDLLRKVPSVYADELRMERILYNLLENAVKYSPQGGEIRVSVRPVEEHLVIGVSDQGIGISHADQAKLFRPFQRLEESRLDGVKGAGLGLLVCRRLVEAHGGRIWVESEPGRGSTFFFTMPLSHS